MMLVDISTSKLWLTILLAPVVWFIGSRYLSNNLRHIPKLPGDWQTSLYRWIYVEPAPDELISRLERMPPHSHDAVRYSGIGGAQRVLILTPAALREVLIAKAYDDYQKPPLNRQRLAMFGNGLLSSDGEEHKVQRKKMLPAFAPRNIRALVPTFWSKACELVAELDRHIKTHPSEPIELSPWMSRVSLDIIGVAAWGRDFNAISNPREKVVSDYHGMFRFSPRASRQAKLMYAAALIIPMKRLATLFPCEFFASIAQGLRSISGACRKAISAKREGGANDNDILSHAIGTDAFDDTELAGQMLNILTAGHETSALATTWTSYLLAKHPDVQRKLREEVNALLPRATVQEDSEVTAETLEALPYLRAVVRESLRVIPTVPVTRREAMRATSVAGLPIPKGTSMIALGEHFNSLPEEWGQDAKEFKPERWLDSANHAADNFLLTFNIGPRSCMGEGFARLEVATLVAALVGRFDIQLAEPDKKPDLLFSITVKPVGLKFRLKPVA